MCFTPRARAAKLERVFAADVVSRADAADSSRTAQKPVVGRERVAKYVATIAPWGWRGLTITVIQANGRACGLMLRAGVVVMLVTIDASPDGIEEIMWFMRPSKLTGVATSLSARASTDTADPNPALKERSRLEGGGPMDRRMGRRSPSGVSRPGCEQATPRRSSSGTMSVFPSTLRR
jgi:hypothetical protein